MLVRQGRPDDALRLLDRLHAAAAEHDRNGSIIEIQALRAIALADRDDDGAVAAIAEALQLAHPEGYVRVFADEGRPMAAVLGRFIAAGTRSTAVPAGYLGRLMRALGPRNSSAVRPSEDVHGLVTLLSARELEVLRLLAAGRANREIASELFVSPHTVNNTSLTSSTRSAPATAPKQWPARVISDCSIDSHGASHRLPASATGSSPQ